MSTQRYHPLPPGMTHSHSYPITNPSIVPSQSTTTRRPLGPTHLNTPPTSPELGQRVGAYAVEQASGSGSGSALGSHAFEEVGGGYGTTGPVATRWDGSSTSVQEGRDGSATTRSRLRNVKSVPVLRYVPPIVPPTRSQQTRTPEKGKARSRGLEDSTAIVPAPDSVSGRKRSRTGGNVVSLGATGGIDNPLRPGSGERVLRLKDSARWSSVGPGLVEITRSTGGNGDSPSKNRNAGNGTGSSTSLRRKASIQKLTSVMAAATAPLISLGTAGRGVGLGHLSTSGSAQRTDEPVGPRLPPQAHALDTSARTQGQPQQTSQPGPRRPLRKMPSSIASHMVTSSNAHASTPVTAVVSALISPPRPRISVDGASSVRVGKANNGRNGESSRAADTQAPEATSDSDGTEAELDPRIVFQKERFLNRHSRDFGHLYVSTVNTTVPLAGPATEIAEEEQEELGGLGSEADTEDARQQRLLDEARARGRERRRSWMLNKAGIGSNGPHANPDDTTGTTVAPTHHRRNSTLLLTGLRSPIQGTRSETSPSSALRVISPIQSVHPNRQTVLSGGPRPLSLVASRHRQLSSLSGKAMGTVLLGPDLPLPALSPTPLTVPNETGARETINEDEDAPRPSFTSDRSAASLSSTGTSDLGHRRRVSTSRYPRNLSRRGMSLGGSVPPTAYQDHAYLTASPSGSSQPSAVQASLPPHLRNFSFSSAHSSSSMSSLGPIIAGGSPASSSCSSGASHLGGPSQLPLEALRFRMSIVERPASTAGARTDSRTTNYSSMFSTLPESAAQASSLRTESRLTVLADEGHSPTSDTFGEEVIHSDDKGSRAVRRRARAFLVSGLKLEQGSRPSSNILIEQDDRIDQDEEKMPDRRDPSRRAGVIIDGPVNLERPPSDIAGKEAAPSTIAQSQRKRYSMIRRERTAMTPDPVVATSQSLNAPLGILANSQLSFASPLARSLSVNAPDESIWNGGLAVRTVSGDTLHTNNGTEGRVGTRESSESLGSGLVGSHAPHHRDESSQPPAITFALFESADRSLSSPVAISIPATPPSGSAPISVERERESSISTLVSPALALDRLYGCDLDRGLFWQPNQEEGATRNSRARQSHHPSIRKAKSDAGIGRAYIAGLYSASPIIGHVHDDAAGASPGRERKSSWSGGVRDWWRTPKDAIEDKAEKGFGCGRGEEHHPLSPVTLALTNSAKAQIPKARKSWKPFSVGRRNRRESLPDSLPVTTSPLERTPDLVTESPRARRSTEPGTAVSVYSSPDMLTPPVPAHVHRTMTYRYSDAQTGLFSPNHHYTPQMMYPGMPSGKPTCSLDFERKASRNTRSPTPEMASATMHSVALSSHITRPPSNRNSWSETNLTALSFSQTPEPSLRKMRSHIALATLSRDEHYLGAQISQERGRSPGPLGGLGLHVEWVDLPTTSRQKGKGRAMNVLSLESQASNLLKLAHAAAHAAAPSGSPLRSDFSNLIRRPVVGHQHNFGTGCEGRSPLAAIGDDSSTKSSWTMGSTTQPSASRDDGASNSGEANLSDYVKGEPVIGVAPGALGPYGHPYDARTQAVLPARLFFFMGFILGPWVWLIGGWGVCLAGPVGRGRGFGKYRNRPERMAPSRREHHRPTGPASESEPTDKWVVRNRIAAVASSVIFIPAMCVGFAYVGKLL